MSLYDTAKTLDVTKAAIAQLIGKGYLDKDYTLDALDDTAIVDLGEKLGITEDGDFSQNSPADIVYKAFLSRIGKIVIENRKYTAKLPKLFVDTVLFGLIQEHALVDISDVMIDEMWNPNGYIPWNAPDSAGVNEGARIAAIEHGFYRPAMTVKLYKKAHAIMVALTTLYDQLFTAFQGVAELNEFLGALYTSVENTLQLKAEIYGKMTISVGVGKSLALGNAIDLRAIYAATGAADAATATAEELMHNQEFQRAALEYISEVKEYITDYTAFYNNGEMATFATDPQMILLTKFERECKFGLRANTYNEKLIGIGDYDTITRWQAGKTEESDTPYTLEAAGAIDFTKSAAVDIGLLPSTSEKTHYLISNVVGVIYDRRAMGVTVDKRKVTTNYTASRDSSNSFYHALISYVVNDALPIVSFYISNPD